LAQDSFHSTPPVECFGFVVTSSYHMSSVVSASGDAVVRQECEVTVEQWAEFWENGFVKIGRSLSDAELQAMLQRVDDIMMGEVRYDDHLMMQLDPSVAPQELIDGSNPADTTDKKTAEALIAEYKRGGGKSASQTKGWKGATRNYRKIGEAGCGLECDPVFLEYMRKPVFRKICDRMHGAHASIGVYRAMLFNKPAGSGPDSAGGSTLPWHQDGGDHWGLSHDPLCFVWTALDPATRETGCVQVVRGSHKRGVLSARGHTVSPENVHDLVEKNGGEDVVFVELQPGETFLCHNWTVHMSGQNVGSGDARRALSVNFVDGRCRPLDPPPVLSNAPAYKPGHRFFELFPSPFEPERKKAKLERENAVAEQGM